jgi:hypothetical protein
MSQDIEPTSPLVPAIFANRAQAEHAVVALRQIGIAQADIGLVVPARESSRIREDAERDVAKGAGRGAAIGGPLGAIGGISLFALNAGEIVALSVGGLLAVGTGGLLWGGVIGGLLGVVMRVRRQPNVDRWCELELDDDSVVIVVRVRDWSREGEIASVLKEMGARDVLDKLDVDHTWRELETEHRSGAHQPSLAAVSGPKTHT